MLRDRAREELWKGAVNGAKRDSDKLTASFAAKWRAGASVELAALRLQDSITSGLGLASLVSPNPNPSSSPTPTPSLNPNPYPYPYPNQLPPLPAHPGYTPSSAVIRDGGHPGEGARPYAAAAAAAAAAGAPHMHADFEGWRCVHDGQTDRLMVSAHGLP